MKASRTACGASSPSLLRLARWLALATCAAAFTGAAHAQYELSGGTFNRLFAPSAPPAQIATQPQFAGEYANSGGSAARADTATLTARHPSSSTSGIVLIRSSFGGGFAAGVPRYLLGDTIVSPLTQADGVTIAAADYWRAQPVKPGESFAQPGGTPAIETPLAAGATLSYYYSPHAGRVFATQAGRVNVTWVTRLPMAGGDGLRYRFREEIFAVSSATTLPLRTIYWTERSFNGPVVNIPGQIEAVNPVYSAHFPATVATEYRAPGSNPPDPSASEPPEKRTLWFQKVSGIGQLHAYNHEGRIFVEYLGATNPAAPDTHLFLAADLVEVARAAPSVNTTVDIGEKITPRDALDRLLPLNASSEWLPAPVLNASPDAQSFYGSFTRPDGRTIYYAERENDNPDRVVFYWLEQADAAIHFLHAPATPNLGLYWPRQRNNYVQRWPASLSSYAHYTVAPGGSSAATGVQFSPGQLPQVVFQDDPAQTEARFDATTQRLTVSFAGDALNRTLLKFTSGTEVWYVRVYTQADDRAGFQESDGLATINTTATVADRIDAPAGYSAAGYIAEGQGYLPAAYINPFTAGATAAELGAIIPVNAIPGANTLKVWWFKRVAPPSAAFEPFFVPAKVGRYTLSYPASPATIIMASNAGSGDLPADQIAGSVYVQNDRAQPGFNPNEEHALMLGGRIYALRDDLNNTGADAATFTSQPFALLRYLAATDQRPAMRAFRVLRELDLAGTADDVLFDYPITAGTIVQPPMPLPLLPLPLNPNGRVSNAEVPGVPDTAPLGVAPAHYTRFTFEDRKGYHWVYRGPHGAASPTLAMQFYYTMREGFFIPGLATQPAVGTVLPYLRPLAAGVPQGHAVTGTALTIIYRPVWPANAPELRVAETLTLPKFGLPAVMAQASAQVLYQQSIATTANNLASVVLHDPIREKTFALVASGGLTALPPSILTTTYQSKTYFQRLPPHLQDRFYFDPLRGPRGSLVLLGTFVNETAGEDYLHLNVLSADDRAALEALPAANDPRKQAWIDALGALTTRVETFIEDPARLGTYKSDGAPVAVGASELARISHSDTAVVDYALTATGAGSGWVTLVFGNGQAFTPVGDPVSVQVIRIAPRLYDGELKVRLSRNPLDEQVSLRHTGDFAARPQDYEFEWRYAVPQDGVAPPTYSYVMDAWTSGLWRLVANPLGALPAAADYTSATPVPLPHSVQIQTVAPAGAKPGLVARAENALTFAATIPRRIVVSVDVADHTGFALYVNGVAALAFQAPSTFTNTGAATGLVAGGLARQFEVSGNYFRLGDNTIEVAFFSSADVGTHSVVDFRIHASTETDAVTVAGSPWQAPNGSLTNQVVVGGSPTAPLGSPLLVMSDNYFTMRYRPKATLNATPNPNIAPKIGATTDYQWSRWMPPQLVEGWIKRVLAAINPFNQRVRDLYHNAVNTDVSMLTQAGARWEGNIALSLENINDFGLIEIYETVLNRGKNMSIDSGYDYAAANDALLLAAGYLADLYTILGNEAYADAANPTISIDDSTTITEVNTSRFSFEGQVKSVLEEELALLRGRDDFLAPGVSVAPAYNRLYWNYTRGINSGEALYAVNYNIREKAGSPAANGVLDAADAQRMFPQAHGDAYGHYLTALTGYYTLLRNPHFTWTPRSEAVTVLGQAVQIDYFDERKFAAAATGVARTAQQVLALTYRQSYHADPAAGWTHFRDGKVNSATGNTRHQGLDEWTSRATQGAYYHWVVANALLPDVDQQPGHTGVQVIDRTTVPELQELTTLGGDFQTTLDHANAHLNPLGLSPGAIAFDISGAELKAGKSHYEQIYERALRAVLNAKGAFDQAARMTRLLRNQENQIGDYNTAIVDQEDAYNTRLIELYGTPYSGEIGPGKTYAQGYAGPDVLSWFVVDRATDWISTSAPITLSAPVPTGVLRFQALSVDTLKAYVANANNTQYATRTVTLQPNSLVQYADRFFTGGPAGTRAVTGTLQQALVDFDQAMIAAQAGNKRLQDKQAMVLQRGRLYDEMVSTHQSSVSRTQTGKDKIAELKLAGAALSATSAVASAIAEQWGRDATAIPEGVPKVTGLAVDVFSGVRGALTVGLNKIGYVFKAIAIATGRAATFTAILESAEQSSIEEDVEAFGFTYQQAQVAYEYEMLLRELMREFYELVALANNVQRSAERVRNVIAEGDRIQAEREIFRQRAAALVQGYRTRDLTFRAFRNEALEQYRTLFDLAGRYTYLAAKSYDYETGLLGSTAGQSVINAIVAARALGDLTGGVPQATVSTLGDSGLAGTMARLEADWSVAKPRLGINNPDQNGTLFSLRRELCRILDDPAITSDDAQWQQTLEQHIMSNVLADADVAAHCRNLRKPDGSAVPGIVIPFSTTIRHGLNLFGLPSAVGDHNFSPSNYATKIYAVGMVLRNYIGMDPYAQGTPNAGGPNTTSPLGLNATPYVYLIPTGTDYLLSPPLGDTGAVRAYHVHDQALPLPFNLGATAFSATQFFNANGTLSEAPWILRKHQAFRPVSDPAFFYSTVPAEFTSSRLVGRSVWNGGWKIVIPAYTLLNNEQEGLNRFVASVKDIELFLRTYSHSGN